MANLGDLPVLAVYKDPAPVRNSNLKKLAGPNDATEVYVVATRIVSDGKPSLGLWRCWGLVVGNTMASAVFLIPSLLSPYGGLGIIGLAAAGLGGLCFALIFSSLAERVSEPGGPYAYTRAAFGDFAGFLVAWIYWISLWSGAAAIATAIPSYLGGLFPAVAGSTAMSLGVTLLAVWVSVSINLLGVKEASVVGLLVTVLKLLPLAAIATAGMFFVNWHTFPGLNRSSQTPTYALAAAFSVSFWCYIGVEAATVPRQEVIGGARTIRRATILGTLTVIACYLLVTVVTMGIVPSAQLDTATSPLATVAARMVGAWGGTCISLAALGSIFAGLHYTILITTQMPAAASRDGLFPRAFGRRTRRGTPGVGLILTGVLVSALVIMNTSKGLVGAYRFIILLATLTSVIPYAFCAIAALLVPSPARESAIAQRWVAVLAVVSFAVTLAFVAGAGADAAYWAMLLVLAGLPVYVVVSRMSRS